MTTWYDATEGVVDAANIAMRESDDSRSIWEPVAAALNASIPANFQRDWPELCALADEAGGDFVGVTSDTRRVVVWSNERGADGDRLFGVLR